MNPLCSLLPEIEKCICEFKKKGRSHLCELVEIFMSDTTKSHPYEISTLELFSNRNKAQNFGTC